VNNFVFWVDNETIMVVRTSWFFPDSPEEDDFFDVFRPTPFPRSNFVKLNSEDLQ
jgi:hypothetical protein